VPAAGVVMAIGLFMALSQIGVGASCTQSRLRMAARIGRSKSSEKDLDLSDFG
jgi:hypothetical protein